MTLSNLQGFLQPGSLKEAAKLLHRHGDRAMIIGGGTFIHGLVARGLVTDVEHLIDLTGLRLNYVDSTAKSIRFGTSTTFDEIERNGDVASDPLLGSVKDAMRYPPPQVKHAATIGGCVAASCPFLDLPIALLAMDATAVVMGRHFKRKIAFEDFFVSLFGNAMKPGEFLVEISLPRPALPTASAFHKLETNANDLAILNASVRLSLKDGRCSEPRVFVGGGVGETPFRCRGAEAALDGQTLTEELIDEAAGIARESLEPLSDHRASAAFRKAMAAVFLKRCLKQASERLGLEV